MFAVPFDVRQLTVTGDPVPAIEGVRRNIGPPSWGAAHVAFSDAGAMAYVPGPTSPVTAQQLFVVDRHGTMEPLKLSAGPYLTPRLSPDGRQLAYATDDGKEANVWIFDLSGTSAPRQLTFGGKDRYPVWSNSGEYVAYASERDGDAGIFRLRADGATAPERLTRAESATLHVPESWSPDGKTLLFTSTKDGASQLMMLSIADRKTSRFADVQSLVPTAAAFSPDGRWVTYTVRDQAHDNPAIYVKRFPPTEATYLITPNGFRSTWSPDGKELFFARRSQSFVVNVATSQTVVAGNPEQLPIRRFPPPGLAEREYDVLPDAQHFIFALPAEAQAGGISDTIEVVLNWSEELNRRVHQ
jgi:Tol biopolymer transport system component